MSDRETEFLRQMELEAGGPILDRAMIRLSGQSTEASGSGEVYGILLISEETLLFKHFANRNWLSSLMGSSSGDDGDKEFSLLIRRDTISQFVSEGEKGFWKRLTGSAEPFFAFNYRDPHGEPQRLVATIVHCESGDAAFIRRISAG